MRRIVAILVCSLVAGCSRHGEAATEAALRFGRGASDKAIVEAAGAPTQVVEPAVEDCARAGGVRELVYTITDRYLGGALGETSVSSYSFCIDSSGTVVDITWAVS